MAKLPYSTTGLTLREIGDAVDDMRTRAKDSRINFERKWYDNNFFDDGYHFRYWSRQQNKIFDLSSNSTIYNPMRAIPKASRQIRGVANLLLGTDPTPVVYPEKINTAAYPIPVPQIDPNTGQPIPAQTNEYQQALDEAKKIAKLSGHWLSEEYKNQDLLEKLALMAILAAKHGISFIQIWPDPIEEAIKSQVFDAFDVYLDGTVLEIEESPFIIKTQRRYIAEIKADERFEAEQVEEISPESKFASSEIKDAYMSARHQGVNAETTQTLIEKEAFVKEYLDNDNISRIRKQKNGDVILQNKKKGDPVYRQVFVEGNIAVKDTYVNLPGYPLVDFRMEPGPIYQTPLIERFIPLNKSLDLIMSRVEKYTHTMVVGSWSKRKNEDFEINNTPGGQIIDYSVTAPVQNQIAPVPGFVFNLMNVLTSMIEEQGTTTTTLGKLPPGVKANAAIETLKETELSNLTIANRRLQGTIKRISEKMLDLADDYFLTPKTVYYLEKGEPQYFDVIGASAIQKRTELKIETPGDVIPLKKNYRVDIEVEQGLAYTREGQKAAAKELGDFMIQLAQLGLINPEAVKVYVRKLFETYGFGATQEIMEAMERFEAAGQMTEQQIMTMKVAMAETMKDIQGSPMMPTPDQRILENQVGVAQAAADLNKNGIPDNQEGGA